MLRKHVLSILNMVCIFPVRLDDTHAIIAGIPYMIAGTTTMIAGTPLIYLQLVIRFSIQK